MPFNKNTQLICAFSSIFFATLALLFGGYYAFSCNAVEFPQTQGDGALSAGLYSYSTKSYYAVDTGETTEVWVSNVCVSYDALKTETFLFTFDKTSEALQVLAIVLTVFAVIFAICSCVVPCLPKINDKVWKGLGLMFLLCCILQGCTMLLLNSSICLDNPLIQYLSEYNPAVLATLQDPDKCTMAVGFKLGISAVVFWFLAGVIPLVIPPPTLEEEPVAAQPAEPDVEAKALEQLQEQPVE